MQKERSGWEGSTKAAAGRKEVLYEKLVVGRGEGRLRREEEGVGGEQQNVSANFRRSSESTAKPRGVLAHSTPWDIVMSLKTHSVEIGIEGFKIESCFP